MRLYSKERGIGVEAGRKPASDPVVSLCALERVAGTKVRRARQTTIWYSYSSHFSARFHVIEIAYTALSTPHPFPPRKVSRYISQLKQLATSLSQCRCRRSTDTFIRLYDLDETTMLPYILTTLIKVSSLSSQRVNVPGTDDLLIR